jgi:hypothetical protein
MLAEDINMKRWLQQMVMNIEQACTAAGMGPHPLGHTALHETHDDMMFEDPLKMLPLN